MPARRRRHLICLLLSGAMLTSCRAATYDATTRWSRSRPATVADTVRVKLAGRIVSVPLEEYVLGSALSEVSPVGESANVATRIFAVQAVIARTYAVSHLDRHRADGFDLCDTTHCQLYQPSRIQSSVFAAIARQAVNETRGRVLAYGGRPALAIYHADCGGHTAAAAVIWGNRVPYLAGTVDNVPDETHRTWTFAAPMADVREALNAATETRIGRRLRSVRITERDDSGRAAIVEVSGDQTRLVRGERLRAILNERFGDRAVLSSRFDVETTTAAVEFRGSGFGHGVGLCQVGAAARARRGDSLEAILHAYFPGAELSEARRGTVVPPATGSRPADPTRRLPVPRPFPTSQLTPAATIAR